MSEKLATICKTIATASAVFAWFVLPSPAVLCVFISCLIDITMIKMMTFIAYNVKHEVVVIDVQQSHQTNVMPH